MPSSRFAFKEGDSSFGFFYPKGYALSAFASPDTAQQAHDALVAAGFDAADILVASGADVLANHDELTADQSLFDRFKQTVSKVYTDESELMNQLLDVARAGNTFVLVYAPTPEDTQRAEDVLHPLHPVTLRKYDEHTIKDLNPAS